MAVKNFVFMKKWIGSEVVGMKIDFFLFLTQLGPTFWPQQAQIWGSLKRVLIFNPLERQKLY